jgi:hypothetical protein
MFFYDPKYKQVLPYYDRFPLVLPLETISRWIYGNKLSLFKTITKSKSIR